MLVRATRDFTVGPDREVRVRKGTIRNVEVGPQGHFSTFTNQPYHFFGVCKLGEGWEVLSDA